MTIALYTTKYKWDGSISLKACVLDSDASSVRYLMEGLKEYERIHHAATFMHYVFAKNIEFNSKEQGLRKLEAVIDKISAYASKEFPNSHLLNLQKAFSHQSILNRINGALHDNLLEKNERLHFNLCSKNASVDTTKRFQCILYSKGAENLYIKAFKGNAKRDVMERCIKLKNRFKEFTPLYFFDIPYGVGTKGQEMFLSFIDKVRDAVKERYNRKEYINMYSILPMLEIERHIAGTGELPDNMYLTVDLWEMKTNPANCFKNHTLKF